MRHTVNCYINHLCSSTQRTARACGADARLQPTGSSCQMHLCMPPSTSPPERLQEQEAASSSVSRTSLNFLRSYVDIYGPTLGIIRSQSFFVLAASSQSMMLKLINYESSALARLLSNQLITSISLFLFVCFLPHDFIISSLQCPSCLLCTSLVFPPSSQPPLFPRKSCLAIGCSAFY